MAHEDTSLESRLAAALSAVGDSEEKTKLLRSLDSDDIPPQMSTFLGSLDLEDNTVSPSRDVKKKRRRTLVHRGASTMRIRKKPADTSSRIDITSSFSTNPDEAQKHSKSRIGRRKKDSEKKKPKKVKKKKQKKGSKKQKKDQDPPSTANQDIYGNSVEQSTTSGGAKEVYATIPNFGTNEDADRAKPRARSKTSLAAARPSTLSPKSASIGDDPSKSKNPTAIAIYSFDAPEKGDLPFNQGDIIVLTRYSEEKNWWRGTCNGKKGRFPKMYIEVQEQEEKESETISHEQHKTPSSTDVPKESMVEPSSSEDTSLAKAKDEGARKAVEQYVTDRVSRFRTISSKLHISINELGIELSNFPDIPNLLDSSDAGAFCDSLESIQDRQMKHAQILQKLVELKRDIAEAKHESAYSSYTFGKIDTLEMLLHKLKEHLARSVQHRESLEEKVVEAAERAEKHKIEEEKRRVEEEKRRVEEEKQRLEEEKQRLEEEERRREAISKHRAEVEKQLLERSNALKKTDSKPPNDVSRTIDATIDASPSPLDELESLVSEIRGVPLSGDDEDAPRVVDGTQIEPTVELSDEPTSNDGMYADDGGEAEEMTQREEEKEVDPPQPLSFQGPPNTKAEIDEYRKYTIQKYEYEEYIATKKRRENQDKLKEHVAEGVEKDEEEVSGQEEPEKEGEGEAAQKVIREEVQSFPPQDLDACDRVVGDHDFVAVDEVELSFQKGDVLIVINKDEAGVLEGWWEGINERTGKEGLFPASWVTEISSPSDKSLVPSLSPPKPNLSLSRSEPIASSIVGKMSLERQRLEVQLLQLRKHIEKEAREVEGLEKLAALYRQSDPVSSVSNQQQAVIHQAILDDLKKTQTQLLHQLAAFQEHPEDRLEGTSSPSTAAEGAICRDVVVGESVVEGGESGEQCAVLEDEKFGGEIGDAQSPRGEESHHRSGPEHPSKDEARDREAETAEQKDVEEEQWTMYRAKSEEWPADARDKVLTTLDDGETKAVPETLEGFTGQVLLGKEVWMMAKKGKKGGGSKRGGTLRRRKAVETLEVQWMKCNVTVRPSVSQSVQIIPLSPEKKSKVSTKPPTNWTVPNVLVQEHTPSMHDLFHWNMHGRFFIKARVHEEVFLLSTSTREEQAALLNVFPPIGN